MLISVLVRDEHVCDSMVFSLLGVLLSSVKSPSFVVSSMFNISVLTTFLVLRLSIFKTRTRRHLKKFKCFDEVDIFLIVIDEFILEYCVTER